MFHSVAARPVVIFAFRLQLSMLREQPARNIQILVGRVLSSTPLLGFSGPASSVLLADLPPSAPLALWFPSSPRFSNPCDDSRHQGRRVSLGKMHHLSISRPTSPQQASPDIGPRLSTPARPRLSRPCSWFAVRYVHGFCLMLPPDSLFPELPLPCWRCPSVR